MSRKHQVMMYKYDIRLRLAFRCLVQYLRNLLKRNAWSIYNTFALHACEPINP